jgi:hypothetical protein
MEVSAALTCLRYLWSVSPLKRSHDYPCSQAPKKSLRKKNVPSTKQCATVALMIRPTVETVLSTPPKRWSPEMPITAQVVKYPSARALALGRGLWELKNRMVRRSKGGAIEPPMARTISLGRELLMTMLLDVVRSMRRRTG